MAAGLGFKDFVTGEVLTAADVDGYLMQGIWVFASATARDAAVTSPQEGNFAYLKDTNTTTYYTGSAWTNLDTTGMVNPMTTTGDTIYSSSGSTPARLPIGTANQVLAVNSGATAPEWKTISTTSGLTLIQRSSFSNVAGTGTTFDGVFTSTYASYFIEIENLGSATAADDLQLVLRASGSDLTAHYGNTLQVAYNGATWTNTTSTNTTQITIYVDNASTTLPAIGQFFVNNVGGTTGYANINGFIYGTSGASYNLFFGNNNATTTYTGFRLKSASSNITGTVSVYGLAKS